MNQGSTSIYHNQAAKANKELAKSPEAKSPVMERGNPDSLLHQINQYRVNIEALADRVNTLELSLGSILHVYPEKCVKDEANPRSASASSVGDIQELNHALVMITERLSSLIGRIAL